MGFRSQVLCQYTSDDGVKYTFRQMDGVRASAGNIVADGTEVGRLPQGLRPRRIHCEWFSAGGAGQAVGQFGRSVVIGSTSNAHFTGATKTIALSDYDSLGTVQTTPNVQRDFRITGRTGEKRTF
jgi:hypothetical protein